MHMAGIGVLSHFLQKVATSRLTCLFFTTTMNNRRNPITHASPFPASGREHTIPQPEA